MVDFLRVVFFKLMKNMKIELSTSRSACTPRGGSIRVRLAACVVLATMVAGVAQAEPALRDFPYWRTMEGWWLAENTYFDGALN